MRILLTNDDGIDAPGLQALHQVACLQFPNATDIMVVAPDRGRSECGHSVTTDRDLQLGEVRPGWFALDGTPVDCVRVALAAICPDVDIVFSGINAGANVGVDLFVSGTFAAAREAALHGKPAMAISHYRRPDVPKTWDHTGDWLMETLTRFEQECSSLKDTESRSTPLWNVNLPAVVPGNGNPPVVDCPVEQLPLTRKGTISPDSQVKKQEVRLESDFHGRPRTKGSDVDKCFSGSVTISRVQPHLS